MDGCSARLGARLALAAALALAPAILAAEALSPLVIRTRMTEAGIVLDAEPRDGPESAARRQDVRRSLENGYRSQIMIQVRLYERARGIAGLLGDPLVREVVLTRVLRHEQIAGRYAMDQTVDGVPMETLYAAGPDDLMRSFFTVDQLALPMGRADPERLYLRARYRLSPIHVARQLTLLTLATDLGVQTSTWTQRDELAP